MISNNYLTELLSSFCKYMQIQLVLEDNSVHSVNFVYESTVYQNGIRGNIKSSSHLKILIDDVILIEKDYLSKDDKNLGEIQDILVKEVLRDIFCHGIMSINSITKNLIK